MKTKLSASLNKSGGAAEAQARTVSHHDLIHELVFSEGFLSGAFFFPCFFFWLLFRFEISAQRTRKLKIIFVLGAFENTVKLC